jgi:DnaK suppressor protein
MKKVGNGMVMFPQRLLAPVREYLVKEQSRLMKSRKRLDREDPFSDPSRTEDNAALDTEVNEQMGHERVIAIKAEVDKALINIRKTLSRIKVGKYGVCVRCKKMIDTDRLSINPTAEYCVSCERELEAKVQG